MFGKPSPIASSTWTLSRNEWDRGSGSSLPLSFVNVSTGASGWWRAAVLVAGLAMLSLRSEAVEKESECMRKQERRERERERQIERERAVDRS
jgi:hypothetical protein